jgi:hypothetical protein
MIRYQGIDIFSHTKPGITPVYAAYGGYVTHEDSWRSTLIMRVPQDPLQPDRQIWNCWPGVRRCCPHTVGLNLIDI